MIPIKTKLVSLTACLVAALLAPIAAAQDAPQYIDPAAKAILTQAFRLLQNAHSFSVRVDATYEEVLNSGAKVEHVRETDILVRRPDAFYAETWDDKGTYREMFYNGKQMTLHDIFKAAYAQIDVPPTIDEAVDVAVDEYGLNAPLADLITNDVSGNFRRNVRLATYVGASVIDETPVEHVFLSYPNLDVQLWIDAEGTALLRKILITYKNDPSAPQYRAVFSDWDFVPQFEESDFTFGETASSRKVEILKANER